MNARLILGSFLLLLIVATAIFGPLLAPYKPTDDTKIKLVETDGHVSVIGAPFPPGRENWLGTNEWGYDILTLLLYGARYTVLCVLTVSVLRVGIGGGIGLLLGINSARVRSLNMSALGGVPMFLIIYFCMFGISINSPFPPLILTLIQSALLVILGIPGIVSVISQKTVEIQKQQYVLAAKTYGAGKVRLAFRHVLPVLKETMAILLVTEAISVLNTLGQLGIFNLFLGGTRFTPNPILFHSLTHEWAGMVGQARTFFSSHQWILFFPLSAFMLALIALYLFSRGLEDYYRNRYNPYSHV